MIKTQLSPLSTESLGEELAALAAAAPTGAAYPTANKGIFIPFAINETIIVTGMWWYQGAAATDNIDLGIYSQLGAKLGSTGATAAGTVSVINQAPLANQALTLTPGRYYMAVSCAGTTIALFRSLSGSIETQRTLGIMQMLAAHPLPSAATLVKVATTDYIPIIGLTTQAIPSGM